MEEGHFFEYAVICPKIFSIPWDGEIFIFSICLDIFNTLKPPPPQGRVEHTENTPLPGTFNNGQERFIPL